MPKPTFIIDFDSTLVRSESLDELARLALHGRTDRETVLRQLREITAQGMTGTLTFDVSLARRLKLFTANQSHLSVLTEFLQHDITPSVLRHRDWFRHNRDHIYVISGGFEEYIVPVVATLGIAPDHVLANAFQADEHSNLIGHDDTRLLAHAEGKVRQVAALGLPHPVIVIGDGYTDYEIRAAGEADEFWAFCENVERPSVSRHADRVLASFDDIAAEEAYAVQ